MDLDNIKQFEQGSPTRLVSQLNRLNQNFLAGPISAVGIARGTLPFVMEVLCREGIFQEELSRLLSIDRAATARALLQLENDGFVERREDPKDRRRKRVYATDKMRDLRDDIMNILTHQREVLFQGFGEQERALFLNMLERMIDNMLAPTAT